jgi:hypothetical protein
VLRPWLQAFAWRTHTYSAEYILTQVKVAKEKGGVGFLLWNANNDYSKPYTAMTEVAANHKIYFRGDEVGSTATARPVQPALPSEPALKTISAPNHRF